MSTTAKRALTAVALLTATLFALPMQTASADSASTPIWVGAPFQGQWPGNARSVGSLPQSHAPVYTVSGYSYKHDWAIDYYAVAGTPVRVYAAPKNSALNNRVTARVLLVRAACASGVIGYGGYQVQVGLFDGAARVGSVTYAHVNPDFNGDGQTTAADVNYRGGISRWGGYIGKVGAYTRNSCWDVSRSSGHHLHMEFANVKNYSCYRPGVPQNATLKASEYMGYLGGAYASGTRRACPHGA